MILADIVRKAILDAVAEAGGNLSDAAKALRIGKTTVYRKMAEYTKTKRRKKKHATKRRK